MRATVVRAQNPGSVTVQGPLFIGRSTRKDSYIRVQGITFEGGGSLYNTSFVTLKDDGFHGPLDVGTNDHDQGNTDTCSFRITVRDLPPVIVIPTNTVVATDPGQCSAIVNYSVRVVDNAPGWSITCSPPPGSSFPKGATPVICIATDSAGNRVTNTFNVVVQDREAPLLRVPADITVQVATNADSAVVTYTATATDNCPGVTVACEPPSGSSFPVGSTIVQCTATDTSGNVAIAGFKVRIVRKPGCRYDDEPPTIHYVTPSKRCLWPANHKMVNVTFKTTATDNSGQPVSAEIVSVTSDEPSSAPGVVSWSDMLPSWPSGGLDLHRF